MKKLKKHEKKRIFLPKKSEFDHKICMESKKLSPISLRLLLYEKIGLFLMGSGGKKVKNMKNLKKLENFVFIQKRLNLI